MQHCLTHLLFPDNSSEEEILDESTGRIRTRSSGNQRNITGALMSGFFGQVSQNLSQNKLIALSKSSDNLTRR
ncbi:hypothetical protein [Nostoc sp. FACHB-888]|uniref:hypothetical protein n=1 Tax=Nostoc sp. FACHB-888 TaxID=2692842 RepID=UPI001F54D58E|nr:hypothetical protein [Nostoc sp. FACHB-888]